jgi:hypothetical protein
MTASVCIPRNDSNSPELMVNDQCDMKVGNMSHLTTYTYAYVYLYASGCESQLCVRVRLSVDLRGRACAPVHNEYVMHCDAMSRPNWSSTSQLT